MDERVRRFKTPEQCLRFINNVKDTDPDLAREARRRAIELRAFSYGSGSALELDLLKAVYAYEEGLSQKKGRRIRASRTWQMIRRHGIIKAAERAVDRPIETTGYRVLVEMGLQEFTFEKVIIRYPSEFSVKAVARSKARMEELAGVSAGNHA